MATARYTSVLDHPLDAVWSLVRDFNNYPRYIDGVSDSIIEDDRAGDEVGAVRRFTYNGTILRQRLIALSDQHHRLSYSGIEPFVFPDGVADEPPPPPARYDGTMTFQRIIDGDLTFVTWEVFIDAAPAHASVWQSLLGPLVTEWTQSLKRALDRED